MKSLSKSQYTKGLQCAKALWLFRNRKDLKTAPDAFQESIMESGTEFGELARKRWPGGVLIKADHMHPEDAVAETAKAIEGGALRLYEAAFLFDDVLVRVDVMERVGPPSAGNAWALYEVKSGTKVEEVHLHDVAIQRYVLEGAGIHIVTANVVTANGGYVRRGALDLQALFAIQDVTEESAACIPGANTIQHMKEVGDAPEAPERPIGDHCANPYPCDFKAYCWAHVPAYSVFNIPYAKMEKKLELFNRGVQLVHQVNPAMAGITDKRAIKAIEVARAGKPMVDRKALAGFLNSLVYPLAHLDFETDNPVIPPYDGLRPYSQMPFQASLRVQAEPGAPIDEFGILGDGLKDPRVEVALFLMRHVPETGTVLAYYKPFEAGRIAELVEFVAAGKNRLKEIGARLADLADPFAKNWYTHPGFLGKWSIKNVLPVLVPSMSYAGLEIKNGTEAMEAYARLRDPELPKPERARIMAALKVYCGQDTEAMVQILQHLYDVVAGKVEA